MRQNPRGFRACGKKTQLHEGPERSNQKATGRVFSLQDEEVDPSVIEGNLVLCNSWVHVLFNIGASHSFISSACAKSLELVGEPLEAALDVMSPMGGCVRIRLICKDCKIRMSDFDIILGMDWLSAHQAVIDCRQRKVVAHTQDGTRFQFKGTRPHGFNKTSDVVARSTCGQDSKFDSK